MKPANILIDELYHCRIGDFSSAKVLEGSTRWTGSTWTPQYAAPELYDDSPYTLKVDVFAFGLIVYEMLVGAAVLPTTLSSYVVMRRSVDNVRADCRHGWRRKFRI
jgi:serine/threonine protein kinase